jgi:hypothetical protein
MLMQVAEVRSSAGQHVRSHSSKNLAVFLKYVRPQLKCVRPQKSTASLSGVRARTQMRDGRTQTREVLARRREVLARRCERPGIGCSAFDRKYCVRPHCRRLICPGTETER